MMVVKSKLKDPNSLNVVFSEVLILGQQIRVSDLFQSAETQVIIVTLITDYLP